MKAKATPLIHISFSFIFVTLIGLVAFILLCRLGCWQWERGKQKEALLIAQQNATLAPPLNRTALLKGQGSRFQRVAFKGTFLNHFTFLLDNQVYKSQAGYHILTPVALDDNHVILVNRGWIPVGRSRALLPSIEPIMGAIPIEGYLDFGYRISFLSPRLETTAQPWPLRIQQVDTKKLSKLINKNIYPMLIISDTSPISNNTASPLLTPARHYAYAFQWFVLAGTLSVSYLISFFKRKQSCTPKN